MVDTKKPYSNSLFGEAKKEKKRKKNSQHILKEKNEVVGLTLLDFRTYGKAIKINIKWY